MDGSTYGLLLDDEDFDGSPWDARPETVSQGILYAEDFDAAAVEEVVQAAPAAAPEPVFSASDVEAAHQAGHRAGFSAAADEKAAVRADLQVAALQSLADALASTRKEAAEIAEERAQALSAAVLAVLSAALPKVTEAHGRAELTAVLEALLPGLRSEPVLRVRVHPDHEACVRSAWDRMAQDEPAGELQLTADPAMAPGDIKLSWADGRAARNTADIWDGIRRALAPLGMPPLQELIDGH